MSGPIVYIDDEPMLCRAFGRLSDLHGVAWKTFTGPREGLAFVLANEVKAIFCDYRMPEMNAIEVLAQIDREVPFYLVSGDLDAERIAASQPRITGVLTKPFRAERLFEMFDAIPSGEP